MTEYYPYEWNPVRDTNGMPVGEAVYKKSIDDGIFWDGLPLQEAYDIWSKTTYVQSIFAGNDTWIPNGKESTLLTRKWIQNKYPLPHRCYKPKAWANKQDIIKLDAIIPFVNERVLKIFDDMCPNEYEAFPIDLEAEDGKTKPFFMINITNTIKGAINLDESRYDIHKGKTEHDKDRLKHVTKLTMYPNCMGDLTLARLYESTSNLAIHPRLIERFKKERVEGMMYTLMGDRLKKLFKQ